MDSQNLTIETLKKAGFTSEQVEALTPAFEKDKITFNESLISKLEASLIKWIVGSMMVLLGLMYAFVYNPLNQRISSVETSLNQRISSVETSLNQRIDDIKEDVSKNGTMIAENRVMLQKVLEKMDSLEDQINNLKK